MTGQNLARSLPSASASEGDAGALSEGLAAASKTVWALWDFQKTSRKIHDLQPWLCWWWMVVSTFQFSGDDSVFFWHRTCRRMRKSCCVPRNGKCSLVSCLVCPAICLSLILEATMPKRRLCWQCVLADRQCDSGSDFCSSGWVGNLGENLFQPVILPPQTAGKPFCFERLSAVLPWTPLMWALWLQSLWWSFAWQQREKVGNLLNDVGKWWQTSLFFWWWNHESWFFWSKMYCFFWYKSYGFLGVLCSFSFKALLNCAELLQVNSVAMAETSFRSWAIAQTLLSMTWAQFLNEKSHYFLLHWWRNVMNLPQFVEFETSPLEKMVLKMRNLQLFGFSFSFVFMAWIQQTFSSKLSWSWPKFGEISSKNSTFTWGTHWISLVFFLRTWSTACLALAILITGEKELRTVLVSLNLHGLIFIGRSLLFLF